MSAPGRPKRELLPLGGQRGGEAASLLVPSMRRRAAIEPRHSAPSGGSAAAKPQAWGPQI